MYDFGCTIYEYLSSYRKSYIQNTGFGMDKYKGLETIFGTFYPRGFIVAMFDNKNDRDMAAQALHDAGFTDTRSFSAQEVIDRYIEVEGHRNIAQRIGGAASSDELAMAEDYIESARDGQSFLVVHADEQQIEPAGAILFQHEAHGVKHYGDWVVTDLTR